MARTAQRSLRNIDRPDRELLHILNDNINGQGWATSDDLADVIRLTPVRNGHPVTEEERIIHTKRCIATRFSWMVRYKFMERRVVKGETQWRLTPIGRDLMNGELSPGLIKALDKISAGDRILVMRSLTGFYRRTGNPTATMMRREWEHGKAGRKR